MGIFRVSYVGSFLIDIGMLSTIAWYPLIAEKFINDRKYRKKYAKIWVKRIDQAKCENLFCHSILLIG